jgi:hypothetical protein
MYFRTNSIQGAFTMNTESMKRLINSGYASLMTSRLPTGEKTVSLFLRSGVIIPLTEAEQKEVYPVGKK